ARQTEWQDKEHRARKPDNCPKPVRWLPAWFKSNTLDPPQEDEHSGIITNSQNRIDSLKTGYARDLPNGRQVSRVKRQPNNSQSNQVNVVDAAGFSTCIPQYRGRQC